MIKTNNKSWLILAGILILLAGITLFDQQTGDYGIFSPEGGELSPNISMNKTRFREFDDRGNLSYLLQTDRATYYPTRSQATFENMNLTIYSNDRNNQQTIWQVNAQRGQITARAGQVTMALLSKGLEAENLLTNDTEMFLDGDVSLLAKRSGETYIRLKGSDLTVQPKSRKIYTDNAISIEFRQMRTSAFGMTADLAARHYVLFGDDRGQVQTLVYSSGKTEI